MLEKPDNKIVSGGNPVDLGYPEAAESITPGMLVGLNSNSKVQKHGGAGEAPLGVAVVSDPLTGDISESYEVGEPVNVMDVSGCTAVLWLDSGESVSEGAELVSAGNGHLAPRSGHSHTENDTGGETSVEKSEAVVGVALEGVDASSEAKRIHVLTK